MLDLASVRLFILAVEFGNLTRAAEAAGTVQPVVSARIKGLEAALGRKLLERTPRFVRPTEDGLSFLAKARALLAAHDDAMRFDDAPTVRFVIGASDHALGTGLEHVIRHVRAALPLRSAVELRLGLSQQVRTAFDEGELDAVIIRREAGGTDGEVLGLDPLGWRSTDDDVVAPDRPIPWSRWVPIAGSARWRCAISMPPIGPGAKPSSAALAAHWSLRCGPVSASPRWGRSPRGG